MQGIVLPLGKISNIQRTIRYSSQPFNVSLKQTIFLGLKNLEEVKIMMLIVR